MNKSAFRLLVLEALRVQPNNSFGGVEQRIKRSGLKEHIYDHLIVSEIIWELLVQGVLAPGNRIMGGIHTELPHFHVTEYGKQCLEAGDILPYDPEGYLDRLQQLVEQPLDDVILTYLRESLLTFAAGRYFAATVVLGVASERCVDLLIEAYSNALPAGNQREQFQRKVKQAGRSVKRRFDILRDSLLNTDLPPNLGDALDIQLSGTFTVIRYSRNDAGHPTGLAIDRDTAYGNLLLFPQYCKRVYGLIRHFQTEQASKAG